MEQQLETKTGSESKPKNEVDPELLKNLDLLLDLELFEAETDWESLELLDEENDEEEVENESP